MMAFRRRLLWVLVIGGAMLSLGLAITPFMSSGFGLTVGLGILVATREVLVAEAASERMERALTGAGLSCATFEGGNDVLEALATQTPDVLLSDIRMPGIDGLALLKQIKQRHPMRLIWVLAVKIT